MKTEARLEKLAIKEKSIRMRLLLYINKNIDGDERSFYKNALNRFTSEELEIIHKLSSEKIDKTLANITLINKYQQINKIN